MKISGSLTSTLTISIGPTEMLMRFKSASAVSLVRVVAYCTASVPWVTVTLCPPSKRSSAEPSAAPTTISLSAVTGSASSTAVVASPSVMR